MEDLVNKSLARRTVDSEDAIGTWYTVHNLQLTFLHEQATNLEALHKNLVDRYRKVYKGKLSDAYDTMPLECIQLTVVTSKLSKFQHLIKRGLTFHEVSEEFQEGS